MIPRMHRRGNSFKGALGYVLHDPGKDSSERVAWAFSQNIFGHLDDAWFEMFDTYRNRTLLKMNAGVELRGRDNKTPVLHYTLSWHANDNPDHEHMKAMALDSLKALGLSEHEAVIACHDDKEHHHVHVVVNTVHPWTGRTAPLKFSKLEFSRWAEAYEREHGIHCEQRIKNNEKRRAIAKMREAEREAAAFALLTGKEPPEPAPFEPVNDNSPNRRRWFERKDVVDRMKALRAALDQEHKAERGDTWARQKTERDALDKKTHAALDQVRAAIRDAQKDRWRDLYQMQKRESRQLREVATHPLERAVFLFRNRARLGERGKPLTIRQMIPLILSGKKLRARIEQIHMRERRAMARDEKALAKQRTEALWQEHRAAFHALRERQAAERAAEREHQKLAQKEVTFQRAKDELSREAETRERQEVQARKTLTVIPKAKAPPGVPLVPKERQAGRGKEDSSSGRQGRGGVSRTTREALMRDAGFDSGAVPVAPKPQRSTDQAKSLLTGRHNVESGVPRAPEKPLRSSKKEFADAGKPRKAEPKKDFGEAADPKGKKPLDEQARKLRMRKDMEKWKRRTARDDFDRER